MGPTLSSISKYIYFQISKFNMLYYPLRNQTVLTTRESKEF